MDTAAFPPAILAEFYRLALLLTGDADAAEEALAAALSGCDAQLGQLRSQTSRHACLALRIRQHSLRVGAGGAPAAWDGAGAAAGSPAFDPVTLTRSFRELPEPERSALAFFYLDLFTCKDIADLLGMDLPTFSGALGRGRAQLEGSLRAARAIAA